MKLNSLRARFRTSLRNRRKLKKLEKADVVILRYPKSGVTWLRVMISNAYRKRLNLGDTELVGRSEFHKTWPSVPNIFVAMDNFGISREELERRMAGKKIVLLLRDPRDVVISQYFSISRRSSEIERLIRGVPDTIQAEGPFSYAVNPSYGMLKIIDFMNYWSAAVRRHPEAVMVRYEALRADTEDQFGAVMKHIQPDVTAEEVQMAVSAGDFSRMKEKEALGTFGLSILSPGTAGDSESFKVRRGKVGGYADYLTPEQKAALDEMVRTKLDASLGYS
jgi:hypothetical protein